MITDGPFSHAVRAAAISGRCERLDDAFLSAFRAAANGTSGPLDAIIRARSLRQGEADMLPILDALLKHGTPLGPGERDMLDALDRGDLRPVGGRRGVLTQDQQRRIAARYLLGGADKQIMADLVQETGMDRASILGWVRQLRSTLDRAPDPGVVLRSIVDPVAESEAIRARCAAADRAILQEQLANLNKPPE